MIYSRTSSYAMQALAYMAIQPPKTRCDVRIINAETGVPKAYLAKIFQALTKAGIISSKRGHGGGFILNRDPSKISLLDVVHATDEAKTSPLVACVMGFDHCSDTKPCFLHSTWSESREVMKKKLATKSIIDLAYLLKTIRPHLIGRRRLSKKVRALFTHS